MDDLRVAQMACDLVRRKSRGHDENPQVRPERAANLKRKGKGEIARQRAFVELVEDDEPDVGELRISEQPLRQKPLGDDFETCPSGHPAFKPHLVSDRAAYLFSKPPRDIRRAVARRKAPRLQDDNLLAD